MVFGIEISTISTLSLVIQIISFAILLFAAYKRKEDVPMHGKLARIAYFIALPSFLYMIYSRVNGFILPNYSSILGMHILLGTLAIFFGILFIANQWRWKGRNYMKLEIVFWVLTFLLGATIYLIIFGFI